MAAIEEVGERLNRIARLIGRTFAVDMGVDESGDRLIFVDTDGDPITNDGEEIIAATPEEIEDKTFLAEFPARAVRAGMMCKYFELEKARSP